MKSTQKRREDLCAFYQAYTDSRLRFGEELVRRLAAYRDTQSWQGAAVLDVGCGDGRIAQAFAGCGAQVTIVERSLDRVANSARRLASQSTGPRQVNRRAS
jgi:2-polyprenyl-3-methyl-5-hydroxy-6-metoxy-1,4-benzoquinol methylase